MTDREASASRGRISRYVRVWWELLRLCFRAEPRLSTLVLLMRVLGVLVYAAIGLALRAAVDGAQNGVLHTAFLGAVGAAVAYSADAYLSTTAFNLRINVVERVGLTELDVALTRDICGIESLDHLEQPEFLDRVTVLRGAAWNLMDSAWAAVESLLKATQLAVTLALLGTVSPWLLLLLGFAAAPLWFDGRGRRRIERAETGTAEDLRLQRHLFELATGAASGKELRITGAGAELNRLQARAWEAAHAARFRAQLGSAAWQCVGWTVFTAGFVGGLGFVVRSAVHGHGSAGDIVLAITVATGLRTVVHQTVSRSTETAGAGRLIEPYLWLRRYAARERVESGPTLPVPDRLADGISLRNLTYAYPGAERPAVDGVSVHLPAGSVVAVVGEYGSGKSTLVKLLCKFHRAQAGSILVDGAELDGLDTRDWWDATAVAFQDFGRYRTTFRETVGLGDLPNMETPGHLERACTEADAQGLLDRLPQGIDTRLGREHGGVDLSEGQWQKTALARACMRETPLLFVLDEPTASLDAPSEHAIFTRYLARARKTGRRTGTVTVVVSHRFSTIAGADLILVMERGRLLETGTHEELMARDGAYAEMYGITSQSYASQTSH